MRTTAIAIALALATSTLTALAQEAQRPEGRPPREGGSSGEHRRPMPPLIAALDANHDGVIDEQEIANAPAALKKLDKNGDGKLSQDEIMPPRPQGGPGDQGGRRPGGGDRPGGPRPEGDKGQPKRQRPPSEP